MLHLIFGLCIAKELLGQDLYVSKKDKTEILNCPMDIFFPNVPTDIECSRGRNSIHGIPVCSFHQMAEYFNEISGVKGNIPLGSFNAMFNFTGSWQVDAASTKSLSLVGYFIPLYEVKFAKLQLVLRNKIIRAVPSSWDPASLARYIPLSLLNTPCYSSGLIVHNLYTNMAFKVHTDELLKN